MAKMINIRGMDCAKKDDVKFNKWYNEIHIPMLMKNPNMKSVTRFKRIGDDPQYPRYLAVYEFDSPESFKEYNGSPEIAAAVEEIKESWPNGGLDFIWRVQYEEIKTWKR
jgi:hypothetical protein